MLKFFKLLLLISISVTSISTLAQDVESQLLWQQNKVVLKSRVSGEIPDQLKADLTSQKDMIDALVKFESEMNKKRSKEEEVEYLKTVCENINKAGAMVSDNELKDALRHISRNQDNRGHIHGQLRRAINGFRRGMGISLAIEIQEDRQENNGETRTHTIWRGQLTLKDDGEFTEMTLDRINEIKNRYRVILQYNDYKEVLNISNPSTGIFVYGVKYFGVFPQNKVWLTLGLKPMDGSAERIPVELTLRDSDSNSVYSGQEKINSSGKVQYLRYAVSPQEGSKGPFEAEINIEHDDLSFNASQKLALANSFIPVSSFENPHPSLWFTGPGDPERKHTSSNYDSNHMTQHYPYNYPELVWDKQEKHSGEQALKINYQFNKRAAVWSTQVLPGKATHMTVWIKGNNSGDELFVRYVDRINYTVPSWARNPNVGSEFVCKLNFSNWRKFRVPVFGDGVLTDSRNGSTKDIDGPMTIMCFAVDTRSIPADKKEGDTSSIWIDDIMVETQSSPEERLTMELVQNEDELSKDSSVKISLGNGTGMDLNKGRINIEVKDEGKIVFNNSIEAKLLKEKFSQHNVSLQELSEKNLKGPVNVDITFTDPSVPGARVSQRVVFKKAAQGGVFQDFELNDGFNSIILNPDRNKQEQFLNPPVSKLVPGENGKALSIEIKGSRSNNNALMHPSLPGIPSKVTMKVKGTGSPVKLQVSYADSGLTGISELPFNIFWTEPVTVDWKGWKEIEIPAPQIPAFYGDKNQYFYRKAWYPLNLIISGIVEKETDESQLMIDDIRIETHLKADEELSLKVDYPDNSQIHQPDMPLTLKINNLGEKKSLEGQFKLKHFQGHTLAEGPLEIEIDKGRQIRQQIVPKLVGGIYELTVSGITPKPLKKIIQVVESKKFFGEESLLTLKDPLSLRKQLSLLRQDILLDWDNSEGAPYLFHYNWFRKTVERDNPDGALKLRPIVGYSADWAGLEARESVENNSYERSYPNSIQLPNRLADWSQFVREMQREYHKEFDEWVFWENPDLNESPQSIPAAKYADMLNVFHRWVKLYNPNARVVAGGFNFDQALPYLDKVLFDETTGKANPDKLKFDAVSVQMNIGELAPEQADLEGFLDDLNQTLNNKDKSKEIQIAELDWGIGEFLSPLQQAAYHIRAQLILDSRSSRRHNFTLISKDNDFKGYGIFWKEHYGNYEDLQTFRDTMVPKPSYFALIQTQKFLKEWKFKKSVKLSDLNLDNNRAYIYENGSGNLCLAYWRTVKGEEKYQLPATWKGASFEDGFSFEIKDKSCLTTSLLPGFIKFPKGYSFDQLVHEIRTLKTVDDSYPVITEIFPSEEDSVKRSSYSVNGSLSTRLISGKIPGGERINGIFTEGVTEEKFSFNLTEPGDVLLSRTWFMESGQTVSVTLNDSQKIDWDLRRGEGNFKGIRKSTLVLKNCKKGSNTITLKFSKPTNTFAYRLMPLNEEFVNLDKFGILKTQQSQGELMFYQSVSGSPLKINKAAYKRGIGMHATGFIEYPLNKQFSKLEVTVGIDAVTEGRGTVRVLFVADGKVLKKTGILNGFSKPLDVTVENLEGVNRLMIVIDDAGDGLKMDYTDIVNGKLYYK